MPNRSGLSKFLVPGSALLLWFAATAPAWTNDDRWASESFSEAAQRTLARLSEQINTTDAPDQLRVAGAFRLPERDRRIYRDSQYEIWQSANRSVRYASSAEFLSELQMRLRGIEDRQSHFKIVRVALRDDEAETLALATISGRLPDGRFEQSSRWLIKWSLSNGIRQPRINEITVHDAETVRTRHTKGRPIFSDATQQVSTGVEAFRRQLAYGQAHWLRRIEAFHGILNPAQNGIAVADVNGDRLDDIYVCQPGGLPNRLFLHQRDGTLQDISETSHTNLLDNTHAALFVDVDNDGDQDLILATAAALLLFSNDGRGQFQLVEALGSIKDAYSLAAADYDNDGLVDLFACGYFPSGADVASLPVPIPYFDARNGGPNHLLQNQGGWKFANVTERVGMDRENRRFSYAVTWLDYDNDGDQDLYVANDFGPDNLYRNAQEDGVIRFEEISRSVGIQHGAFGMSAAAGDFNGDGFEDIYVANMYSSAGNRVTRQPHFRPAASPARRTQFQRLASGNSLFKNVRGERFDDVGADAGVALGRWSWGANFIDLNNDGWQDLLVTNGYITGDDPNDL